MAFGLTPVFRPLPPTAMWTVLRQNYNPITLVGVLAGGGHSIEMVRFGGSERTYQAWWGIDSTTMYGGTYDAAPTT